MERDRYDVFKVKGADPEKFCIVFISVELTKDSFIKTTPDLTESELRTELAKMGCTEAKIDSLIERARENPR